jgi:hypothetical protein
MTDQQEYIKSIIEEPLYTVQMKVELLDIYVKQTAIKSSIETWERSREVAKGITMEVNK